MFAGMVIRITSYNVCYTKLLRGPNRLTKQSLENHPVLSSVVKRAATLKGAKLIVVDPRRIQMTRYATKWLRQNLGTDVAWINGLMHVIIKEGLHDKQFIENRTEGFDELQKTVET